MFQRGVDFAGFEIVQDSMAMAERAAFDILPGKADRRAFQQQGAEGQHFGATEVDSLAGR